MDETTPDAKFESRILAKTIGDITGEPQDVVILRALEERLLRLTAPTTPTERAQQILNVLETSLWQNTSGSKLGETVSREREDEVLGYGPEGI